MNPITQFCFATVIRGPAKLTFGKGEPRGIEAKRQALTSRNVSSLVIDSLCDQARRGDSTVSCFYFDFAAQKEQSLTNMLGALLKQVVSGLEDTPEELSQAYQNRNSAIGGRGPPFADIVKLLQSTCSKKPTFICIDALDECSEGYRVKLLDSLNQILQKSPGTRIFVTGRPYIRPMIGRRLVGRVTSLAVGPTRDDIIEYINTKLGEDTNPDAMDSSLEADILKKIPEDISGMYVEKMAFRKLLYLKLSTNRYISRFLLVSLNIDAILQETTIHRRRQKLNTMTDGLGLGDAYGATLDRIKGQGGEKARLGMATLMWISHAERPLKPDELCHALAVEIGSPNLNSDNVPSIGTLLACCQGLVAADKEASTIRLIHFTLQEYLRAHPELFGAHSTIAETCLSYLNSQQVKALSFDPSRDLRNTRPLKDCYLNSGDSNLDWEDDTIWEVDDYFVWEDSPLYSDTPFLEYSSLYWGTHAKRNLSDCAKLLALKLFDDYNTHIPAVILLDTLVVYPSRVYFDKISLFSGLHWASIFGIDEIVASLVEAEGCDINQKDCAGYTPLCWAARNGHEGVAKILLGWDDINPEEPGQFEQTPLCFASEKGHEGVVKILLGRDDVNPEKSDESGQTPLSFAAENGHEGVVKILLGRDDVSPDRPGRNGQTPLSFAAEYGHEGVVKILLGQDDVNPEKPDQWGQTTLCYAAENGHEGVVKILLGQDDVNPEKPDKWGRTPLYFAASDGHEGVVKILLGRDDVNPEKPGQYGLTPLGCAAMNGHEGVVKILLGRDDVNPNKPNEDGETPLSFAIRKGHKGLIALLQPLAPITPSTT